MRNGQARRTAENFYRINAVNYIDFNISADRKCDETENCRNKIYSGKRIFYTVEFYVYITICPQRLTHDIS